MANERNTENIVRGLLRGLDYYNDNNCIIEEQNSKNPRINKALKNASKGGTGVGRPEFLITFKDDSELLIVVECKPDVTKHISKNKDQYSSYAVDGVLLYSNYLSKEYNVISIAVSGETEKELRVSHFIQLKGAYVARDVSDKTLLNYDSYKVLFKAQSTPLKDTELIKKAIEFNEVLHSYSVPETERNTLISSILISLQDNIFIDTFHKYEKNYDLAKDMIVACKRVLEKNKISDDRKDTILHEYGGILYNNKFIKEVLKKKSKTEPNTILKDLITDLRDSVLPFIKENDFDILGRFYREFIRYAGKDSKTGLVLTPTHITDFFCEIADLQPNDIVYDPCCGTAGFLVSAMKWMVNAAGNDTKQWKRIKEDGLIGVETRPDMFTHACSNMMMRGDGKSNIYNDDCFHDDVKEKVKEHKPNKGFLNPPYDVGIDGQLEFVENTLECLEKGGMCIAICQMSTVVSSANEVTNVKERLLKSHTLKAVFSMPDQLFYPVGVVTCILVFTAHIAHPKNKEVFFGYLKDDGHILLKHKGRLDDGSWKSKKEKILDLYINNKKELNFSVTQKITAEDEWCAEAYMETDYSKLSEQDFLDTIKSFIAFEFVNKQ